MAQLLVPFGDHQRYKDTYFLSFQEILFTGDGALETRLYRITGRVDDVVIVSGHNLGTAQLRTL
jgi:acetyl-CoA synthetase